MATSVPLAPRARQTRMVALVALVVLGGLSLIGPSGLLAWSANAHALAKRTQELQRLTQERDQLKNRVALLDPRHVDPDLAGQLLRANLNVVHPDEKVMLLN